MSDNWIKISSDDEGDLSPPGGQIAHAKCTIYRHAKRTRFRAICNNEYGSNQGYFEPHGGSERQYRADSLDELMRVSIAGERDALNEKWGPRMASAIRNAVAEAEDALDEEKEPLSA